MTFDQMETIAEHLGTISENLDGLRDDFRSAVCVIAAAALPIGTTPDELAARVEIISSLFDATEG